MKSSSVRINVVLPAPFAPTRPITCPGSTLQVHPDDAARPTVGLRQRTGLQRQGIQLHYPRLAGRSSAVGARVSLGETGGAPRIVASDAAATASAPSSGARGVVSAPAAAAGLSGRLGSWWRLTGWLWWATTFRCYARSDRAEEHKSLQGEAFDMTIVEQDGLEG